MSRGTHVMKSILALIALATTCLCLGQVAGSVVCPGNVPGEAGTDIDVACNISGVIELVYWYKGVSTGVDLPILALENGEFGGTEFEGGTFQMREDGAMVINNLQREHEGAYTIKVYFRGGSSSTSSSVVSVYNRPLHSCPTIESCDPTCEPCVLTRTNDGVLGCSISGVRPKLDIAWEIVEQNHMNFVERQPVDTEEGGMVKSSVSIVYRPAKCGARAVLRCVARNSLYELEDATVTIRSDPCGPDPGMRNQPRDITSSPADEKDKEESSAASTVVVPIICIALLLLIIGAIYFGYRRYGRNITSCYQPADRNRATLVHGLVDKYMDEVCVEPEDGPDSPETYRDCQCTYVQPGGTLSVRTIDDLFTMEFLDANDRILFVAKKGFGKQTTTNKLLVDWSKSKHEYLLLYIPMGELTCGSNLFEKVKERYASNLSNLTVEDIEEVCKRNKCLVLLGNLEDLNQENLANGESGNKLLDTVTFERLLEGDIPDTYQQFKVWATSREYRSAISHFKEPYTKVTIKGVIDTPV